MLHMHRALFEFGPANTSGLHASEFSFFHICDYTLFIEVGSYAARISMVFLGIWCQNLFVRGWAMVYV